MKKSSLLGVCALGFIGPLGLTTSAHAESIPALTSFIESQIDAQSDAMAEVDLQTAAQLGATNENQNERVDDEWFFRRLWVRVQLPMGVEVPWLIKVKITPEVEMLWERPFEQGWTSYRRF
jgi:hypothetical protein